MSFACHAPSLGEGGSKKPAKFTEGCDAHFDEHDVTRERSGRCPQMSPAGRVSRADEARQITEDARKYAAQRGINENEALEKGLKPNAKEFAQTGAEVYAKA